MMKKIIIIIFFLIFYASIAFADAVEDRLPPGTPDKLKASTRQMILAGLKDDDAIKVTRSMLENKFTIDNTLEAQQRYTFAYGQAAVLTKEKTQIGRLGNPLSAALAAGLKNQDAAQICSMIQNKAQTMNSTAHNSLAFETLKTARDMARLSVASQAVADVLIQALQKGYRAEEMKSMRVSFMSRSRTGSPQNLAKSFSKAIQQGKSIDGPAGMDHSGDLGGSGGSSGSGGTGGSDGSGGGSGGSGSGGGSGGGGSGGSGSGGSGGGSGGSGGGGSGGSGGNQ